MKHLKDYNNFKLNEDIIHSEGSVPQIGARVTNVYKSSNGNDLYILIENCDPVILVGNFKSANVSTLDYSEKSEIIIDGENTGKKWKELFKK